MWLWSQVLTYHVLTTPVRRGHTKILNFERLTIFVANTNFVLLILVCYKRNVRLAISVYFSKVVRRSSYRLHATGQLGSGVVVILPTNGQGRLALAATVRVLVRGPGWTCGRQ